MVNFPCGEIKCECGYERKLMINYRFDYDGIYWIFTYIYTIMYNVYSIIYGISEFKLFNELCAKNILFYSFTRKSKYNGDYLNKIIYYTLWTEISFCQA